MENGVRVTVRRRVKRKNRKEKGAWHEVYEKIWFKDESQWEIWKKRWSNKEKLEINPQIASNGHTTMQCQRYQYQFSSSFVLTIIFFYLSLRLWFEYYGCSVPFEQFLSYNNSHTYRDHTQLACRINNEWNAVEKEKRRKTLMMEYIVIDKDVPLS